MQISAAPTLQQVAALLQACALPSEDIDPASLEDFFVVTEGSSDTGVVGLQLYGSIGLLRSVAVLPSSRNKGLGALLVRTAEDHANSKGARSLYLLTNDAAAYFTKLGYTKVERASAPEVIQRNPQFGSACCSCATLMWKEIGA